MQVYRGIAALSDFRKAKLLARLQAVDRSITRVEAEYVHLVDVSQKLSDQESGVSSNFCPTVRHLAAVAMVRSVWSYRGRARFRHGPARRQTSFIILA